ncbi:MAG: antitoxin [Nakamurella sp.]
MVDFSGLADKAKNLVAEHSDQVKGGVEKVGDFVGNKIGHDKADAVEGKIGEFVDKLAADRSDDTPAAPTAAPVVPPPAAPPVTPPAG